MAVADTKVPLFKEHFWHFQIKIKFQKKSRDRAASDYQMLISPGLSPVCTHGNENKNNDCILVDYFSSTCNFLKKQFT